MTIYGSYVIIWTICDHASVALSGSGILIKHLKSHNIDLKKSDNSEVPEEPPSKKSKIDDFFDLNLNPLSYKNWSLKLHQ